MSLSLLSRVLLRWAWGLLFLWFGTQQLIHPAAWTAFLPSIVGYLPIPAEMIIQLNGWSEVCLAILLLIGCYTRVVAAVLAAHLAGIAVTVGGAIGVRDGVLAMVGVSFALDAPDAWTLDHAQTKPRSAVSAEKAPTGSA